MKYKLKTNETKFEFYSDNSIIKGDLVGYEGELFKVTNVIHEIEEMDEVTSIKLLAIKHTEEI